MPLSFFLLFLFYVNVKADDLCEDITRCYPNKDDLKNVCATQKEVCPTCYYDSGNDDIPYCIEPTSLGGGLVCTPSSSIVDDGRFRGQCDVLALTDADKDDRFTYVFIGLAAIMAVVAFFALIAYKNTRRIRKDLV